MQTLANLWTSDSAARHSAGCPAPPYNILFLYFYLRFVCRGPAVLCSASAAAFFHDSAICNEYSGVDLYSPDPLAPTLSALNSSVSAPPDMYHRPLPTVRTPSTASSSTAVSPCPSPLLSPSSPSAQFNYPENPMPLNTSALNGALQSLDSHTVPTICGMPLKYVS